MLKLALAGNPNCGKTTLFNRLTGSRAHVGNWPGVTVERKEGVYHIGDTSVVIVDLPGIYSLSPYSEEEVVSRDYILNDKPDLIINIVDATNIERNLYLTSQLMETGVPIVLALNMMDEVEALGDEINIPKMENRLGIKIMPISASKNMGIEKLMETCVNVAQGKQTTFKTILSNTVAYPVINRIKDVLEEDNKSVTMFSAIKLLENDEKTSDSLNLSENTANKIKDIITNSEKELNIEWEIYVADLRYQYITQLTEKCIHRTRNPEDLTLTDKIDLVVTNRFLAIPVFLAVMFLVFQITFGSVGSFMTNCLDTLINEKFLSFLEAVLLKYNVADWLTGLIVSGIVAGVGMVIVFLPQILLLFLFLSILEDTGYMSRAAFIMDRLLRRFGLSGKSFVPMLMGFGCSVPAIMAARTLENERDRRMTIILTPFMSCGARMPVYAVFGAALFGKNAGLMIISLYCMGVVIALLSGLLLKGTILKGEAETFIMELPTYRMPSAKTVILHVWEKAKEFVVKAFTILLVASVAIWFLQNFDLHLNMVDNNTNSILGSLGHVIAPIFKPCGYGNWRNAVALLTGFAAKEAVVSTLGILYGLTETAGSNAVSQVLANAFTPLSAYSFLVFVLLYMPCVVAFSTIHKEMNSWKWTFIAVGYQTLVAWIASFLVYQIGSLFFA
jgi:ferrous iron transport protein B